MCGIVGYIGERDALPIVIEGLEKLEYRGYDSAGVAMYEDGELVVSRALGKLAALKEHLGEREEGKRASPGIGHTRWATHGKPSENNAHPHTAGRVSLIHNGIIENYIELREELTELGCVFTSETDTEIAAQLLNHTLQSCDDPFVALEKTCERLRGSYAFLAIDSENSDRILVAKNATPIVIGIGENERFIASDIPAVLNHTRDVVILEDGDFAEIRADSITIRHGGETVERPVQKITWDPVTAQKGGYKHFMLKEIHDQVRAISDTFRGRIERAASHVVMPELSFKEGELEGIERIVLLACGTAWHACLLGKFYIESLAKIPCEVDYASEFRYRESILDERTLVIAISQSGETADTLAVVDQALGVSPILAICNVLGSTLTRKVDNVIYTHAGPEISVASTKAFTTQLVAVLLAALYLGERRGVLGAEQIQEQINDLLRLPSAIDEALKLEELMEKTARKVYRASDFLYIARGVCYPIALEGALKLKEISYIHAEGYPAGELKHGPIALVDENVPVVVVLQRSDVVFDKTLSNLKEVESRGGRIIAVTDVHDHKELHAISEQVIEVPYISERLSPFMTMVPLQFLAYYVAVLNGTDVDLPRNLAKSVTVE